METIKNYLDNMFATLPSTKELLDLKGELYSNMEEKYLELKQEGKSENEAIGIVISEFGNIDELVTEMGLKKEMTSMGTKPVKEVTKEEADRFIHAKKIASNYVAIGVSLIFIGVIGLLLLQNQPLGTLTDSSEHSSILSVIFLLLMVAIAVAIFIYSGQNLAPYAYIEKSAAFQISSSTEHLLQGELSKARPKVTLFTTIGVILCILSPVSLFIANSFLGEDSVLGVCSFLFIVMIAVDIFICLCSDKGLYQMLLKEEDYSEENKKADAVLGGIAAIVFPLATFLFLFLGLVFQLWYICWIVFPIAGVLYGGFCSIYKATHAKEA